MASLEALLVQNLSAHSVLVLGLAFVAGIVSSVLPCTIAMLPVMVGYIGGYSQDSRKAVFLQAALFVVGLALVMSILGVIASILGLTFGTLIGGAWYYVIGALAILIGLNLLGVFTIPVPPSITKFPETNTGKIITPLLMGITFGIASSPCGTPFLAAILGFISREGNILLGGASLFCYALGQGTLLLIVGLFTGLLKHMAVIRHVGRILTKMSGIVFIIVGIGLILLASGTLG